MVPVVHSDRFAERSGQFTHAGRTDRRPHSRGQIRERWVCHSLDFHERARVDIRCEFYLFMNINIYLLI